MAKTPFFRLTLFLQCVCGAAILFCAVPALPAAAPAPPARPAFPQGLAEKGWVPLLLRLQADKIYDAELGNWFALLPEAFSPAPMGATVSPLFRMRFMPRRFPFFRRPADPSLCYPDTVTPGNVALCRAFLQDHAELFLLVEQRYAVSKEVLAALLLVETRLGKVLGRNTALWTLACLASSREPAQMGSQWKHLSATREQESWLRSQLKNRSERAYAEFKAFIAHCRRYGHNPLKITGSSQGAIGLCQFMPSNINPYGVDGDGDGKIDLFSVPDALHSAANFLKLHGWKNDVGREGRLKVLRRYNNSQTYVNTVLTLAENLLLAENPSPSP